MAALVHGTYWTESSSGFVADFCPVCRDIETFNVIRVGDASHIAFVSLGNGRLAGYMIRCGKCGTGRSFAQNRYASVAQQSADKNDLIALTFPNVRSECGPRLEIEKQIRENPAQLPSAQREELLMEPFSELNTEMEQLDKGTRNQKAASMWGMLALGAVIGTGGVLTHFNESKMPWITGSGIVAFLSVWIGMLVMIEKRELRRRVLPSLQRALKPLRPTKTEIATALKHCRDRGLFCGKKLKTDQVWNLLET